MPIWKNTLIAQISLKNIRFDINLKSKLIIKLSIARYGKFVYFFYDDGLLLMFLE